MMWAPLLLTVVMVIYVHVEGLNQEQLKAEISKLQKAFEETKKKMEVINTTMPTEMAELSDMLSEYNDLESSKEEMVSLIVIDVAHLMNDSTCKQNETHALNNSITNLRLEMEDKLKEFNKSRPVVTCSLCSTQSTQQPVKMPGTPQTCQEHRDRGSTVSGIYTLDLKDGAPDIQVHCDMDTDNQGWIVFQRRKDGSVDFTRGLRAYKDGFGHLKGEFWLGLVNLRRLTKAGRVNLRVDMKTFEGKWGYAEYSNFTVLDESDVFQVFVSGYSGDAGDGFTSDTNTSINEMKFSTVDSIHDKASPEYDPCPTAYKAGWWYNFCHLGFPNGKWGKWGHADWESVIWPPFTRGKPFPLKYIDMKLK